MGLDAIKARAEYVSNKSLEAMSCHLAEVDIPALVAAVQAVLAQHKCVESWRSGVYQCGHCAELCHSTSGLGCGDPIDAVWPCPTVLAIRAALEDTDGDTP